MSWLDTFGLVNQQLGATPFKPPKAYTTWNTKLRQYGHNGSFGGASSTTWNDLASGRVSVPAKAPAAAFVPAGAPERINVPIPYSANQHPFGAAPPAPAPPHSTEGDLFGSILGAAGSTIGNLNLANAVPWFMERINVLADEMSKSDIAPFRVIGQGSKIPLDAFATGVTAASDVIAPVLNAFPDWVRDSQLHDRAKLYRAMLQNGSVDFGIGGPVSNPLGTIAQLAGQLNPVGLISGAIEGAGNITGRQDLVPDWARGGGPLAQAFTSVTGSPVSTLNSEYENYKAMLLHAVDPAGRASADQKLGILRSGLDLPPSVKVALERNPNMSDADIEKALATAAEGRQWSYQGGIPGIVQNIGAPLLFYIAEAKGLGALGGQVGALGAETVGAGGVPGAIGSTIGAAAKVTSIAAKLQKYSMAAGLGFTAVSTTMDSVARYQGNQAAIDWFDRVNRTSVYSDDPAVQLVTGFSVNPFAALKSTKAGAGAIASAVGKLVTLPLAKGLGEIPIAASLGKRMTTFAGSDSTMLGMIQRMYNLGDPAEASTFVDQHYENRGQAFDEVMGVALDEVLDRIPKEERATINASFADPVERTAFVVRTYGGEAMTLLEKDPAAVASRWQLRSWGYHNYPGRFNAEVAAANARDYRIATARTYELRAEHDAVTAYRESFPPEAQAIAAGRIEKMTQADGTIPVEGANGVQGLVKDFPVLRNHWTGLISDQKSVPRATVERIVERATADWQREARQNPVRARTGADPILRPDSPNLEADTAEALGTTVETLRAIDEPNPTADGLSMIRAFVADKTALSPEQVAGLSDADVIEAAQKYATTTTAPWHDLGASVVAAEKQMRGVREELVRLRAMPKYAAQHDEIVAKEREMAALLTLTRAASDPIVPFATSVAHDKGAARLEGRDIHLTELAARRAEATTRLNELQTIHDAGAAMAGDAWHTLFSTVEGAVGYSGGLPAMTESMRRALRVPAGTGDYEAWQSLGNNLHNQEHLLTKAQRRRAHEVLDSGGWKHQSPGELVKGDPTTGVAADEALDTLGRLWRERKGILSGTSEYSLRRSADVTLPAEYMALSEEMVQSGTTERAIIHDPRFERVIHPQNVARLQDALASADTFPAAAEIINADPVLSERLLKYLNDEGYLKVGGGEGYIDLAIHDPNAADVSFGTTFDVLGDAANAAMLKAALIPGDFVRPTPGVLEASGLWDKAILSSDRGALEQLARDMKEQTDSTPTPPTPVPARVSARVATRAPRARPSTRYARKLAEADGTAEPDPRVLEDPTNRIGVDVLSVISHGVAGRPPATINGVVGLLRAIENGDAKRAGIGADLAAEGQRVANDILDAAVRDAPRPETSGIFTKGVFPDDELALAADIDHLLKYDDANPLATLQYGLKKRPKAAVVLEWSKVPGLAEEMMTGRFEPFEERVWNTHARQAYNWIFGAHSNAAIRAESKFRFIERAGQQGVDGTTAAAIHDAWRQVAHDSRSDVLRKLPGGERRYVAGDNPLYADVHNIPNSKLDAIAHATIDDLYGRGKLSNADKYVPSLHNVDYAAVFRESSSFTRRELADHGGKLGQDLARAYGMAVHNKAVTTAYYWFRFGLDIRYHAMNYLEAQILYWGRAGLKKGEVTQGYLGQTEQYLRNLDADPTSNTGYPMSQDRMASAYRTFLKEQPDALRGGLKGLQAEDPALMQRALDQLAVHDPQIADMRKQFGDAPEKYLAELDAWHSKMLNNASLDETAAVIDESMAQALRESPDLAEVYGKLAEVNKNLWDDVRQTFYGNPDRSRAERLLNSYLLFWPLSYQIKATKWFAKVLFDRAGGVQTNAAGAVIFDQMATTHQQLLATDPEYKDWFEKHPTLTFVAQMMFPVSFDSMGVSLNPALRSMFFDRNRAIWDIGPVYTFNHVVPQVGKEVYSDLYPLMKDVPGFDGLYRTITGKQEPKAPGAPAAGAAPPGPPSITPFKP